MENKILSIIAVVSLAASAYYGFVKHDYDAGMLLVGIALGTAIILVASVILGGKEDDKKDKRK